MLAHSRPEPVYAKELMYPITVELFQRMVRAGILTDDDPVELLEETLVFSMPQNEPHSMCLRKATYLLVPALPAGWFVQFQQPIQLDDGMPEPDATIVAGSIGDFATRHPRAGDVVLVIEIADTTLIRDRGIKLRSYARAGIATYWIVNLESRCVEIYSDPDNSGPEPVYRSKRVVDAGGTVRLMLGGQAIDLPVDALLA
jgi:Uma2 family endonuclease